MRLQDASLKPRNPCPVCGAETVLAEIEPHPLHVNFEIHGYFCDRCGPVKSLVAPKARALLKFNVQSDVKLSSLLTKIKNICCFSNSRRLAPRFSTSADVKPYSAQNTFARVETQLDHIQ
jgi:hypothetical protein